MKLTFESLVVTLYNTIKYVNKLYVLYKKICLWICMSVGMTELHLCATPDKLIAFFKKDTLLRSKKCVFN